VVLEALQCGLPVVCFKLGGPGVVVDDSCGAAVAALADVDQTVAQYANAVLATLERLQTDASLANTCRARANTFTWEALIERVYGPLLPQVGKQ
jgi:glycosyltransferase involved in cell wall biosynthesis